jgi:hypothetical protein
MRDALRTCLQIAGGLTEATRRRTVDAARDLIGQTGIDVEALQQRIGSAVPAEVQTLADELMASGRANRDLLLGLIREEIDKGMGRVGRIADEVTKVGVVLETLERRIRNLENPARPAPGSDKAPTVEHVRVEPEPAPRQPARPARTATAKPSPTVKPVPNVKPTPTAKPPQTPKASPKSAPAPAKKADARKTAAKKTATTRKASASDAASGTTRATVGAKKAATTR